MRNNPTRQCKYSPEKPVFLPPYSPELNPIEEAWSKFKQYLKRAKAISTKDCEGYFQHVEDYFLVIN